MSVSADRVTEALADTPEPLLAAEQFVALLAGPIDKRARLGARRVLTTELRAVTRAAVHTFLQEFAPKTE